MAIKGSSSYLHRVITHPERVFVLTRRATGKERRLEMGDEYFIRPSSTNSLEWRVVFEDEGLSRVYTVGSRTAAALRESSADAD